MKTLTSGDIAKYCDVNLRTVIRWIDSGRLKGYKLPGGGNNRVKEEDFVAFLTENKLPIPADFASPETRVLIVDDELQVAKAISRVTKRAGYDSVIATDPFMAGALLTTYKPQLMTLDLSMPGVDGYDIVTFARQEYADKSLKILIISALGEDERQKAIDLGADAALAKPFANKELLSAIDALLRN
ncbi:response regulator [Paraglaciecola sp. 20A4]|uniref:response regulator n=1 Tax=Paraglaciecola sp. 20A4 TaxID=2687288 RepID=UPI00140A9302|nr:response regulator [Paraglaciecola sp. 20A4]